MLMEMSAAVSLANIGLLAGLLFIYGKIYSRTRATFTAGLMFFAAMLVVHNAITVYGYFAMAPLYAEDLMPYFFGISLAELAGISVLFKITL
jgi:hypothetical protein